MYFRDGEGVTSLADEVTTFLRNYFHYFLNLAVTPWNGVAWKLLRCATESYSILFRSSDSSFATVVVAFGSPVEADDRIWNAAQVLADERVTSQVRTHGYAMAGFQLRYTADVCI